MKTENRKREIETGWIAESRNWRKYRRVPMEIFVVWKVEMGAPDRVSKFA